MMMYDVPIFIDIFMAYDYDTVHIYMMRVSTRA